MRFTFETSEQETKTLLKETNSLLKYFIKLVIQCLLFAAIVFVVHKNPEMLDPILKIGTTIGLLKQ